MLLWKIQNSNNQFADDTERFMYAENQELFAWESSLNKDKQRFMEAHTFLPETL